MGCASSKSTRTTQTWDANTVDKVIFGLHHDKSSGYTKPQTPLILDPRTSQRYQDPNTVQSRPNRNGNFAATDISQWVLDLERARNLVKEISRTAVLDDKSAIELSKTVNKDEFNARLTSAARRKRPRRPATLDVTAGSCTELTIEWTVNSRRKNCHEIHCTPSDGGETPVGGIADVGVTTFSLTNLKPATEYDISVVGVSCEAAVILKSEPVIIKSPTGAYFKSSLRPREITNTSVSLKWDSAIGRFDNYSVVHQGPDGDEVEDAYVGPESRSCKIEGLKPNVKYLIKVRVVCSESPVRGDETSIDIVTDGKYGDRRTLKEYLQSIIDTDNIAFSLEIDREKPILQQSKTVYSTGNDQKLRCRPEIEFTGDKNTCDIGGPRREFFSLLMQSILIGYQTDEDEDDDVMLLFEGADDHKVFVHDEVFLEKEIFSMAGKMVQHSILWGGPGLVGLAQSVKDYVRTGSQYEVVLDVDDVPDLEIRETIQSLIDSRGSQLTPIGEKPETRSMLSDAGVVNTSIDDSNKHIYIQELLLHNIVRKRQREMDQFRKGFDCLSLAKFLMKNADVTDVVFPKVKDNNVTFSDISQMLKLEKRDSKAKKETARYFMKYLEECDNRRTNTDAATTTCISLSQVLFFITGCPMIPPKSYGKIKVSYHNQPFPVANTCFQELHLPLDCENYDEFRDCLDYAISNTAGFGLL